MPTAQTLQPQPKPIHTNNENKIETFQPTGLAPTIGKPDNNIEKMIEGLGDKIKEHAIGFPLCVQAC